MASEEDAERLAEKLVADDPNEALHLKWGETIRLWDHLESAEWTEDTSRHSSERRELIYRRLSMPESWTVRCDEKHPPRLATFAVVSVIGADWTPWYTQSRREGRRFFWSHYESYLRDKKGWRDSIQDLDRDSTAVVERIGDPEALTATAVRGLVVGYVQSGKTANFTAVIAKAVDAGYRLIIVLAGTLNILRNQTQRRLDKELLGKEIIESRPNEDGHDYFSDTEWPDFISYGGHPSEMGGCDWRRLTTAKWDYQKLKAGIAALEFGHAVPGRPYNDPRNLHRDSTKLLVVKKSPNILRKVIGDLKRLRVALAAVPALVIDDESDLASVNTLSRHTADDSAIERTKTNAAITDLLKLLPRSSYVGYTATPAATVLMNDEDDLFPRDFIIPLPKPAGYMGVAEFIDPDDAQPDHRFREACYVRSVQGDDRADDNLPKAVDSFVLGGAIKILRERMAVSSRFRHHTMLVHRSHQMSEHEKDRVLVRELFDPGRFLSESGLERVARLLEEDFATVSERLAIAQGAEQPIALPRRQELPELVRLFFDRLHPERVLVANGDPSNEDRAPDFDTMDIWAILVGGTKLSRGYTVEGLTVSYYRRRVAAADTLMQMGRWFGYRKGYADLVRVFLGREERKGMPTLDLHEEFRACCLDEEEFRAQLLKYASDGENPLRPVDVPPLVYNSGLLEPTSKNKMRHARRAFGNFGGEHKERTLAPSSPTDISLNWKAFKGMLDRREVQRSAIRLVADGEAISFAALSTAVPSRAVIEFLKAYRWSRDGVYRDIVDFLEGSQGDPEIDDWCVLSPQLSEKVSPGPALGTHRMDVIKRSRIGDRQRYKTFSDPSHVIAAKWIAGIIDGETPSEDAKKLRRERRAVLVVYACKDDDEREINLGFFTCFPKNRLGWRVAFVTDQA